MTSLTQQLQLLHVTKEFQQQVKAGGNSNSGGGSSRPGSLGGSATGAGRPAGVPTAAGAATAGGAGSSVAAAGANAAAASKEVASLENLLKVCIAYGRWCGVPLEGGSGGVPRKPGDLIVECSGCGNRHDCRRGPQQLWLRHTSLLTSFLMVLAACDGNMCSPCDCSASCLHYTGPGDAACELC